MTRLSNISTRQRTTRLRDAFFTLCIAATAALSIATLAV
jgi:hypothetical protein